MSKNCSLDQFQIHPEIQDALSSKKPVVALESTLISHGMPYPANVETALSLEKIVRDNGATPATIAVIQGKICVGLASSEIEQLGTQKSILKLSRRDLSYAVSTQKDGATTVAATMICAAKVGISIFATGGLGGVHRKGESTLDISADLQELSQTPVGVVCSGVKAILDIERTLEVLETLGVPVVGHKTYQFPAFYYKDSGFSVDFSIDTPLEIARLMQTQKELGLKSGFVIANPIPEEHALDKKFIEENITLALEECDKLSIKGKAITPFLLSKLEALTQGKSLKANIALIKSNAALAAQIASAL